MNVFAFKTLLALGLVISSVHADGRQGRRGRNRSFGRTGRQNSGQLVSIPQGVDFSNCEPQPDGTCCVIKETRVSSLEKDPLLECTHKNVEKCHYTYVTQFKPSQEEVCEENFEKKCQITFKQVAQRDTVRKCLTPLRKVCDEGPKQPTYGAPPPRYGSPQPSYGAPQENGEEECRTFYESSCTTKYIEKQPGKFVGDTKCEKQPIKLCGQGCRMVEEPEECHDKEIDVLVDVPEEICDLNPQKTCRFQTKLVPSLEPQPECTIVPQEVCNLRFSSPRSVDKPLQTRWCIDPYAEVQRDQTYDEANAYAPPLGSYSSASAPQSYSRPPPPPPSQPSYGQSAPAPPPRFQDSSNRFAQTSPAPQGYGQPQTRRPQAGYGRPQNGYERPERPQSGYERPEPSQDSYGRPEPPQNQYGRPEPPQDQYGRPEPPQDQYGRPEPPQDQYGRPEPPQDQYGSPEPPQDQYGSPEPPQDQYGSPEPPQDQYGSPEPPRNSYGSPVPAVPSPTPFGRGRSSTPTPGPLYYKPSPAQSPRPQPGYGQSRGVPNYG